MRFGATTAVDGVDLDVGSAETVAILGPSGCGKTTLLRAIAGLQPLDGGRVTWDGADLGGVPPHRRRFGLMFQEYALFPHRDVTGNVAFGLRMAGVGRDERDRRVAEVLDLVGLAALAIAASRSCRAVSSNGWRWRARSRSSRGCSCSTSPSARSIARGASACSMSSASCSIERGCPRSTSPTITRRPSRSRTGSSSCAGRVVQAGTPADVWHRPADPWTAAFLGFAPAVAARLTTDAVETPWGLFPVDQGGEGPVQVVLRPDAMRLDASARLGGKVVRCTFAGDHAELEVETAGPRIRLRVPLREAPAVGDAVGLTVEPDGVLVYPVD